MFTSGAKTSFAPREIVKRLGVGVTASRNYDPGSCAISDSGYGFRATWNKEGCAGANRVTDLTRRLGKQQDRSNRVSVGERRPDAVWFGPTHCPSLYYLLNKEPLLKNTKNLF